MTGRTYAIGLFAERLCVLWLRLKFYRILETRYKTPVGEIDILAVKGNTVIAVEVKARPTSDAALEAIAPSQRARIARALEHYIARHPEFVRASLRFDVMAVVPSRMPLHIKNAWQTS